MIIHEPIKKAVEIFSFAVIIFFLPFESYPQNKIVDITASGFKVQIDLPGISYKETSHGQYKLRDYFQFTDESNPGALKLPNSSIIIAVPFGSTPKFEVEDFASRQEKFILPSINPGTYLNENGILKYNSLEYGLNNSGQSKTRLIEIEGYFWFREYYCAKLRINSHLYDQSTSTLETISRVTISVDYGQPAVLTGKGIKEASGYDAILNEVIVNYDIAPRSEQPALVEANDSLYDWIDFNATYLKLGTANDGIYRLFKSDLENYGINTNQINPQTFKLILKGNELPIYVEGENDASFDDSDFIEFYGSINYAEKDHRVVNELDEPYTEYIDRYTDTTVYWLTWNGANGLRADTTSQLIPGIPDTIDQYTAIVYEEQNNFLDMFTRNLVVLQNPEWIYNETWFWGQQGVGSVNRPFNVSNLVTGSTAKAFFRALSYASNAQGEQDAHNLGISINLDPTVYDSGYINKYDQKVLMAEFPSDLLQEGTNNLVTHSFPVENAAINSIVRDWYEIEYPRELLLFSDSLKFQFKQIITAPVSVIEIGSAQSSNFVLHKIKGKPRRLSNFLQQGDKIFFADSVVTGDEFYITEESKIGKPKIYYAKQFQDIVNSSIQADYILISHPVFNSTVNSYIDLIENNYFINAEYINVLDIYDQFNYGFFSPEPIKEFLRQANLLWSDPKPSYVFLVGESNYDYHNYRQLEPHVSNIVPSFGHPVSDNWFVIWDPFSFIPQMFTGRLAVKSEDELLHYTNKHQKYLNDPFNVWNKSYFLMSGGSSEAEKTAGKNVNYNIKLNFVQPAPTGGYTGQLYATENPRTNFGPFTQEFIDSLFDNGGVVVSYVGHSGTKIWDNGIENVDQLKNKYNKYPLINDFGCSTGKFAEPDVTSFSEAFVNGLNGDAIAYLGNSSLGFTSTSYTFPGLFFEKLLTGRIYNLGEAHVTAKIKLLNDFGLSQVNTLFSLTNSMIGDPLVTLKIPTKPNLMIESNGIDLPAFLDDNLDSVEIQIRYRNLGLVDSSLFNIKIEDRLNNQLIYENTVRHSMPLNDNLLLLNLPVKNRAGEHNFQIILDAQNEVDEIYEDDNSLLVRFNVLTTSVRAIVSDSSKVINDGDVTLLNSVKEPATDSILIRLSSNPGFTDQTSYIFKFDTVKTPVSFNNLTEGRRYWYKTSFTSSPGTIFEINSFVYSDSSVYNFAYADSFSIAGFNFTNTEYRNGSIQLSDDFIPLVINSAGFEPGGVATITLDNVDYAENSQGCGHHIVVIDEETYSFEDYRWFNNWNDPNNYEAYYNYMLTIPEGKLVAISIGGDCGGFNITQELKDILHQFGSAYIDSVGWGSSWIFLGKLNAPVGSVPEKFSTTGPVEFDTLFVSKNSEGMVETNKIMNSGSWKTLTLDVDSIDNYSQVKIKPVLHKTIPDTLDEITWDNTDIDLSHLNSYGFNIVSFYFTIQLNEDGTSPLVRSIRSDYDLVPELGTNYQVVSVSDDTVTIGENISLDFYVYNVGETTADSFNVKVELVHEDNTRETISNQILDSLDPDQRKYFSINYNTSPGSGEKQFLINIDADNQITELYEDNNFYLVPFFVKPDTTTPSLNITFDGHDIIDGDYISAAPGIRIELSDPSLLPITDPSSIMIYLNEELIPSDTTILNYEFSETNPKVVVNFNPTLADGEYLLRVLGKDASGNIVDSTGVAKFFLVSNEAKLLYVFNYPNPTSGETHFTFKLTQIPEEIRIRIFTIAGRLVKELRLTESQLTFDFNKIYWDGRDDDGDQLANGVYFYKVIMKAGDKTEDVTQKLAIVR